ncbi:hypothetical protein RTH74_03295 [Pseudomonas sp. zfem001]|uniref:hypothetical protein n=1 Tax=Pseudomonas sp. zfem001 TaxID=3078196 RepID=UPI002927F023|nr:hypothetical protein [Pseudomonas sp. zfem001]MDU9406610.1 hypothetical protein [Pseudomonas sp. zfem001]
MKQDFSEKHGDLFRKHFEKNLDDESALLKAHLLIEEMLRDFCLEVVPNPLFLREARLTFKQTMLLTRSLLGPLVQGLPFDWVWNSLNQINKLRNMLAHELEPSHSKAEEIKETIIKINNENRSKPLQEEPSFKGSLSFLCGALHAMLYISAYAQQEKPEESSHIEEPSLSRDTTKV